MKVARYQFAALGGALLLFAPPSTAQRVTPPVLTVSAGHAIYDLSGTGSGPIAQTRVALPVTRWLVVEPTLTYFRYAPWWGGHRAYLFADWSMQAQVRLGSVRPYFGAGGGIYTTVEGPHEMDATIHATSGLRIDVAEAWGLRGEMRLRTTGIISGQIVDWSFGVARALR